MVIDIVYNIALLLSLSVVYSALPQRRFTQNRLSLVGMGLVIGGVGLLIMSRPLVLVPGVVFDGRSILLSVTGMFFGAIPTTVSALMMIVYRIIIGGGGVTTGLSVIVTASLIGITWNHYRLEKFMKLQDPLHIELYGVGLLVHVVMLLCMFLMPREMYRDIFLNLTLPILLVYPLGTYLLAMLIHNRIKRIEAIRKLQESEYRFKTIFDQAPMGITVTDSLTGEVKAVNDSFLNILGMERSTYFGVNWHDISHPDDIAEDEEHMRRLLAGEITSYAMDKRYIRPNGSYVWTNMAVTLLIPYGKEHPTHLCMITDIAARKEMEQAILWANRHDVLTGLDNRQAFEEALGKNDKEKFLPLSVLIGDVNGLKVVNDAFGRAEGDHLLKDIADILTANTTDGATCSRIGGDEFALIMPRTSEDEAWKVATRISAQVSSLRVRNVGVTMSFGISVKTDGNENVNDVLKHAENGLNRNKLSESPSTRNRAIHTIISTLHEKNRREELHSRRVSVLVARLAEAAGLGEKKMAEMRTAGLLHDIGKIAIDESILNKEGQLDEEQWNAVKRHPETGWRILGSVGELGEMANYILSHHERVDGKGYPRGLVDEEIPMESKMIAIADAYDAMTATRTYRAQVDDRRAAEELKRCSGTQFDETLARLFVGRILQLDWDSL